MRVKTKIGIFIALVIVIFVLGIASILTGKNGIALVGTAIGVIGAAVAGISSKRKSSVDPVADADKRSRDAERENRAAVGSMDSVSIGGESIRAEGERLVQSGDDLVESSKSLIDELRASDASANKNP